MKVSRKRPSIDSQEKNSSKDKAMEEEEEEQQQEEDEEIQEEEEEEEEGEEEQQQQQEQQEPPRLEEGFYEIEAIRKKRVRKAQLQYLIKWRGWPESANTWEPVDNLQACSDVVDAFEERLHNSSRKRKRRGRPYGNVGVKNLQGSSADAGTETPNGDGPDSGVGVVREDSEGKESEDGDKMREDDEVRVDEEKNEDGRCISIQLNGGSREEEGLVEDGGSPKVDNVQPLHGAKKRKSGCVRRFKQDVVPPQGSGDGKGEKLRGEDVDSTEDDNSERQKLEEDGKPPYIAELLRAVEFQASVTNNVQQVSIKFKALRSDGQEVLVDDKELKVKNPLLLISFYEQHLRYSPPTCDVNKQQS